MPQKYGDGNYGKVVFGGSKPEPEKRIPQQEFTPVEPDIAPPRAAEEIGRRLHMANGSWGQRCILYQQQNDETTVTRDVTFIPGTIPFSSIIWERGNKKQATPNHPNIRKLIVTVDGAVMSQVNEQADLFGSFSFYAKEENDKSKVTLIFSDNFNPNKKVIKVKYYTVCVCVDLNAGQSADPDCPICFGLTTENAYKRYFNPRYKDGLIRIRKQHSSRAQALEQQGYTAKNPPQFRSEATPRMSDKDIIEIVGGDFEGLRFFIINHELHYLGEQATSQTFNTAEITKTDPIYKAISLLSS